MTFNLPNLVFTIVPDETKEKIKKELDEIYQLCPNLDSNIINKIINVHNKISVFDNERFRIKNKSITQCNICKYSMDHYWFHRNCKLCNKTVCIICCDQYDVSNICAHIVMCINCVHFARKFCNKINLELSTDIFIHIANKLLKYYYWLQIDVKQINIFQNHYLLIILFLILSMVIL